MRTITRELRSYVIEKPWLALVLSFSLGMLVIMLFPDVNKPRSAVPGFKEGFLIVLATAKLIDPAGDLGLSGSRVQFARHGNDDARPCLISHPPLHFSANERNITLSGSMEDLESTVLSLTPEDLKHVDLAIPQDSSLSPCTSKVKIIYGQEG